MLAVLASLAASAAAKPLPFSLPTPTPTPTPPSPPPGDLEPVRGVISRVLGPEFVPAFELSVEPTLCDVGAPHGCFALRPGSGATTSVQVAGSSVSELTAGVGHYLRTVCNASLSWQGTGGNRVDQLRLPLPSPPTELHVRRADRWSYYQNVCTPSFSFVWYSWEQWEAELDLLALSGVNLVLAYVGQEAIYQKTFRQFGVADADIRGQYFSGPAFLAWNRGQDLRGLGGPLPQSWIDSQWRLQRQILGRMRSLGMTPALPAFQGWVPLAVARLFPNATISRVGEAEGWCPTGSMSDRYECPAIVDALDCLFGRMQAAFLQHLT